MRRALPRFPLRLSGTGRRSPSRSSCLLSGPVHVTGHSQLLTSRQEACTLRWPFRSRRLGGHGWCSAASGRGSLPVPPRAPAPVLTLRRREVAEAMAEPEGTAALRDRGQGGCPSPRDSRQRGRRSRGEASPPLRSGPPEPKPWPPLRHGGRQLEGGAPAAFALLWKVPEDMPGATALPLPAWHPQPSSPAVNARRFVLC